MSNYKSALGIGIELTDIYGNTGQVVSPSQKDRHWWNHYSPNVYTRYDTPDLEKWRHRAIDCLPIVFRLRGVHSLRELGINAYDHQEEERRRLLESDFPEVLALSPSHDIEESLDKINAKRVDLEDNFEISDEEYERRMNALLKEKHRLSCPVLKWKDYQYRLFWDIYGGDYWLWYVWRNVGVDGRFFPFWEKLHAAGTRGIFVLEVGSEQGVTFRDHTGQDVDHELCWNSGHWPGWYIEVADLRGDEVERFKVYDDPDYLEQLKKRFGIRWNQNWRRWKAVEDAPIPKDEDLYLHCRYREKLIEYCLRYPYKEELDESGIPASLHREMRCKALQIRHCRGVKSITRSLIEGYEFNQLRLFGCDHLEDLGDATLFSDITELHLTWAVSLTDISALSQLKKLKKLRIHCGAILRDFSPIAQCVQLQELDLEGCTHFTDTAVLEHLSSLTTVNLKGTGAHLQSRCGIEHQP